MQQRKQLSVERTTASREPQHAHNPIVDKDLLTTLFLLTAGLLVLSFNQKARQEMITTTNKQRQCNQAIIQLFNYSIIRYCDLDIIRCKEKKPLYIYLYILYKKIVSLSLKVLGGRDTPPQRTQYPKKLSFDCINHVV